MARINYANGKQRTHPEQLSRAPRSRCNCCQSTTRRHAHRSYRMPRIHDATTSRQATEPVAPHLSETGVRRRVYGEWSFVRRAPGVAIKALGRRLADNRTSGRKEKEVHRAPVGYEASSGSGRDATRPTTDGRIRATTSEFRPENQPTAVAVREQAATGIEKRGSTSVEFSS